MTEHWDHFVTTKHFIVGTHKCVHYMHVIPEVKLFSPKMANLMSMYLGIPKQRCSFNVCYDQDGYYVKYHVLNGLCCIARKINNEIVTTIFPHWDF